jgi:quercetin dioxygenase-like cupin family protein
MRIVQRGEVSETYGGRFTGSVELEMLQPADADNRPDVARVHFREGAVTNWHSHPGGQHLYLVEGRGRVGMPDREHDAVWLAITWGTTVWEDAPEGA